MSGDDEYWERDRAVLMATAEIQRRIDANKPRPEWWSPTREWLTHAREYPHFLRLSVITAIGQDLWRYDKDKEGPSIGAWIGDRGTFSFEYDTPEHRDEDFERLKEALNI